MKVSGSSDEELKKLMNLFRVYLPDKVMKDERMDE